MLFGARSPLMIGDRDLFGNHPGNLLEPSDNIRVVYITIAIGRKALVGKLIKYAGL